MISLSERPTRVLIVGMFLIAAATAGVIWALIGGWVALIVAVAGFGQVLWAVRSRWRRRRLTPGIGIPRQPPAVVFGNPVRGNQRCCHSTVGDRGTAGSSPADFGGHDLRAHADQWQAAAGCTDPPTRNKPGTGLRLAGRSAVDNRPLLDIP